MRLLAFLAALLFSTGAYAADPIWNGSSFDTCTLLGFSSPSQAAQPGLTVTGSNCPANSNFQLNARGTGTLMLQSNAQPTTIGGTLGVTGSMAFGSSSAAAVFGSGTDNKLTITPGAGSAQATVATSNTSGLKITIPTTVQWNPTNVASGVCSYFCSTGFPSGTLTGTQTASANQWIVNDKVTGAANTLYRAGLFTLNVAPNGNSAVGPRVGVDMNLTQAGSLQGGSISNSGISSGARASIFMESNLGGTSTLSTGAGNGFNPQVDLYSTASYVLGASGNETDVGTQPGTLTATLSNGSGSSGNVLNVSAVGATSGIFIGSSIEGANVPVPCYVSSLGTGTGGVGSAAIGTYNMSCSANLTSESMTVVAPFDQLTGDLLVETSNTADIGRLGPAPGHVVSSQAGSPGFISAYQVGQQGAAFALGANGKAFYIAPKSPTSTLAWQVAAGLDTSSAVVSGVSVKAPYYTQVPMCRTGVTGSARLTSDCTGTPTSYIYDVNLSNRGTGYTSNPVGTVTGCTADVEGSLGAGNVIAAFQVRSSATNCPAETAISAISGGGSSAAASPIIVGNTLNFAINSIVDVTCYMTANEFGHSGSSYAASHITFVAKMGATASTTAISGSPSWTSDGTGGSDTITFATPTADTTLGAINLSVSTVSAGTWDVGGYCHMARTTQQ